MFVENLCPLPSLRNICIEKNGNCKWLEIFWVIGSLPCRKLHDRTKSRTWFRYFWDKSQRAMRSIIHFRPQIKNLLKSFKVCKTLSPEWHHNVENCVMKLVLFRYIYVLKKIWMFRLGNIERRLAQVSLFSMMYIIIWIKTNIKIQLEQTCTLFFPMQK